MLVDSPSVETQSEKPHFDPEVVDVLDSVDTVRPLSMNESEEEVVLDSEDENLYKTQLGTVCDQLEDLVADSDASASQQCNAVNALELNKGLSISSDNTECGKISPPLFAYNDEFVRLSYVASQEPGESSQANAIDFVNHFLSFNDVNMYESKDSGNMARAKSPPVLSAKGLQRLAKNLKHRNLTRQMGNFEWVDNDQNRAGDFFGKKMEKTIDFRGFRQRLVNRHSEPKIFNCKGGTCSLNECVEKNHDANHHKDEMRSNQPDPRFLEQKSNEIYRTQEVSITNKKLKHVKAFDDHVQAQPSVPLLEDNGVERDLPDILDVGINTQIAAEAMEALLHWPPASRSVSDACKSSHITSSDFSMSVSNNNGFPEKSSLEKNACSYLGNVPIRTYQRKRSTRQFSREKSSSPDKRPDSNKPDPDLALLTKEKRGKLLNGCQSYTNGISGKNCPEHIEQRKRQKTVIRDGNEESKNFMSSSWPGARVQSKEEPVVYKGRGWVIKARSKGTEEQSEYKDERTNNMVEDGILTYRRKRRGVVSDPLRVSTSRGNYSKKHFIANGEARSSKLNQQDSNSPQIAAIRPTTSLQLKELSYPRRKRTCHRVQSNSKGSRDMGATVTMVTEKELNTHSAKGQERSDSTVKTPWPKLDIKEKANWEHSSLFQHSSEMNSGKSLFRQNFVETALAGIVKAKVDTSDSEYTTINLTSSNSVNYKYHEETCKKNLPKSSLLKELIRLGVPESLPDFTWKDLRRRKDLAYVQVLFSQHLDDDTIKQQKKILARLGISNATCSMDSTHFIADRFVRTKNMLEAIALGKPVVTPLWLESCRQASCLIDEKPYILRDAKKEKEIGFSMPVSLTRASQHPLLQGQRVYVTPKVKPDKDVISDLVKAVRGQVIQRRQISIAKDQTIWADLLILSCEEDYEICEPLLDKGATVYNSELLLNGILIQKLEYKRHQLFKSIRRSVPQINAKESR